MSKRSIRRTSPDGNINPKYAGITHGSLDEPYDRNADPASGLAEPKRKKRVFLWVFLAVNLLFVLWLIFGLQSVASTPADTGGVLTQEEANSARDAGAAIGGFLIFALWVGTDIVLGIGYAIYRLAKR